METTELIDVQKAFFQRVRNEIGQRIEQFRKTGE